MSRSVSIDLSLVQTPQATNANINLHFRARAGGHHDDDEDDDVVLVSDNVNAVIDLCSPEPSNCTPARRAQLSRHQTNTNQLVNRRSSNRLIPRYRLPISDSSTSLQRTVSDANRSHSCRLEDNPLPAVTILICPICMESLVRKEPTATHCGHIFCKNCLEQSLMVNPKCPLCRTKINRKRLVRLYIENILN